MTPGSVAFKLAFELSPIFLTGGIAENVPGGGLPIVLFTEAGNFVHGLLASGGSDLSMDNFFAHFQPMPGGTLIDNQVGSYPFANQAVAANSIIAQPLTISMLMLCPARSYPNKTATLITLQSLLKQHNSTGGTYTVITPGAFMTNCLMTSMRDVSSGQGHQAQSAYQIDFIKPLLTLNDAESLLGSLMLKLDGGTQISGQPAWSGTTPAAGAPNSVMGPDVIPSSVGSPASSTSPFSGGPPT